MPRSASERSSSSPSNQVAPDRSRTYPSWASCRRPDRRRSMSALSTSSDPRGRGPVKPVLDDDRLPSVDGLAAVEPHNLDILYACPGLQQAGIRVAHGIGTAVNPHAGGRGQARGSSRHSRRAASPSGCIGRVRSALAARHRAMISTAIAALVIAADWFSTSTPELHSTLRASQNLPFRELSTLDRAEERSDRCDYKWARRQPTSEQYHQRHEENDQPPPVRGVLRGVHMVQIA